MADHSTQNKKKSNKGTFDFNVEKIPSLLRNRYFLISIIFAFWIFFADKSNIIAQFRLQHSLQDLQEKKSYYEREIGQVKRDKKELFSTQKTMEKFAREKYYMKKSNEDVFVIIEEE